MTYVGGCHCGAVRFQINLKEAPRDLVARDCNCSICAKVGFVHWIVPASRFQITAGESSITTYTFNSGVARHTFCRVCGVKPFYVPRSNPDGVDVNMRCVDNPPPYTVEAFDGINWERNAGELAHLSSDFEHRT